MKTLITLISIIFIHGILIAQNSAFDSLSWNKIIIKDSKGGLTSWHNEYIIEQQNLNLVKIGDKDSVLYKVDPNLITALFKSIHNPEGISEDPLLMFGKDSLWLINNAEALWIEYQGDRNKNAKIDSIAIRKLKSYGSYKKVISKMQGSHWRDDYPLVVIDIISDHDTIVLQSIGHHPFMLPWIGTNTIYNCALSLAVGEILPENKNSNKKRLKGNYFNKILLDEIYINYLEKEIEFEKAKKKYKYGFKRISKHFQIDYAEICMMGSIEWGGLIAANCLELQLKDSTISKNIQFSTVFGRRILPYPLTPIIRKKKTLIKQLTDNPVYKYCIYNDNCLGEIHFVNRKSLSRNAKRNFLSDVKDNNQDKRSYKGKFRKAIFFELTENKNGKRSFSRWIFLNDGTIVLWQLQGDYLMNLSFEAPLKNGYICEQMNLLELNNMPNNK